MLLAILLFGICFTISSSLWWLLRGWLFDAPWEEEVSHRVAAWFGAGTLVQLGMLTALAVRALL